MVNDKRGNAHVRARNHIIKKHARVARSSFGGGVVVPCGAQL